MRWQSKRPAPSEGLRTREWRIGPYRLKIVYSRSPFVERFGYGPMWALAGFAAATLGFVLL
jgi:hypothetical protein